MKDSMPSPFEFDRHSSPFNGSGMPTFFKTSGNDEPEENTEAETSELTSEDEVTRVFDNKGPLSEKEGYKIRPGQVEMAKEVLKAIYGRHNLVVEAGTGVGKTFAYLVPILLSGRKALISTYSKALQDQLFNKDIKFLKSVLGVSCYVSVLKGASNYICLKGMSRAFSVPEPPKSSDEADSGGSSHEEIPAQQDLFAGMIDEAQAGLTREQIQKNKKIVNTVKNYLKSARTGEIEEFKNYMMSTGGFEPEVLQLNRLAYKKAFCNKKSCPFSENCFLSIARKKAKTSQIVVLNQSLLCYGVQNDEMLFPKAGIVVVDEAHKFEDTLRDAFSAEIGTESFNEAISSVFISQPYEKVKKDLNGREKKRTGGKKLVEGKLRDTAADKNGEADNNEQDAVIRYEHELLSEVDKVMADLKRFVDGKNKDSFLSYLDNMYTDDSCSLLPQYEKQAYRISTCASVQKNRQEATVTFGSEEAVLMDLNIDRFIQGLYRLGEKVGMAHKAVSRLNEGAKVILTQAGRTSELKSVSEEGEAVLNIFVDTYNFIGGIIQYINTCRTSGMMASAYYYWYTKVAETGFTITKSPFRPSMEFKNFFLSKEDCFHSFIFASATIDTGATSSPALDLLYDKKSESGTGKETDFQNFRYGIGLSSDNTVCRLVYSPFDFKNNAILCVPEDLANFTSNYDESKSKNLPYSCPMNTIKMLAPVINATKGGIFILVTSYDACHRYAEALRKNQFTSFGFTTARKVLEQERNSTNNGLISKFKEAGNAILIGTKSFWEGVDIPGDALSLVIIDKIPFPQKTVHKFMTRMRYESEGMNAFDKVDVTSAIIDLKQGVGRLIRTETDKGAVIICSKDLLSSANKSYAGRILNSLSYFNITNRIEVVRDLMENDFKHDGDSQE